MSATVFRGGVVFDGSGSEPRALEVEIRDGLITAIGESLDATDATVVDIAGATLVPGAIDAHVHLTMSDINTMRRLNEPFSMPFYASVGIAERTVAGGITTVRDAGGADAGLREAIATGLVNGPRTLLAINMISQTGGHNDGELRCGVDIPPFPLHPGVPSGIADGPDDVRRIARTMIRAGADHLKVATTGGVLSPNDDPRHPHFRPDELEVLVAEADAAGIAVMAHAQGTEGIANAVRAGVRSIEHGIFLDDETIELMLDRDTWLVPTLVAPLGVLEAADRGEVHEPAVIEKARMVVATHREAVAAAVRAGVRIALGTDAGISPHGKNLRELELLVECGMTPFAAWHAATGGAAELLGMADRIGGIEVGKFADLVVIDGDLADITDLPARVRETWIGGELRHRTKGNA